jgi:hypothetical protein
MIELKKAGLADGVIGAMSATSKRRVRLWHHSLIVKCSALCYGVLPRG